MGKETARVYCWLISEKSHLKDNCTRKPPYDWNDFKEQWKDEAVNQIALGGDQHTSYYWDLASRQDSGPNWIARWFLYHKFRHTDGRGHPRRKLYRKHSSKTKQEARGQEELAWYGDHPEGTENRSNMQFILNTTIEYGLGSFIAGHDVRRSSTLGPIMSRGYYESTQCRYPAILSPETSSPKPYYDPIRDI